MYTYSSGAYLIKQLKALYHVLSNSSFNAQTSYFHYSFSQAMSLYHSPPHLPLQLLSVFGIYKFTLSCPMLADKSLLLAMKAAF